MAPADARPGADGRPLAALSFDVEQLDIAAEHGLDLPADRQFGIGREGLRRVVALLARRHAPATFFVTAEFAERYPDDVAALPPAGHEIASHGLTHGDLRPGDLERSRLILQDVAGTPVLGFRRARLAPTDRAAIARAGYRYDAGENPIWLPGRYNHFFSPRRPRVERTPGGDLAVIPASATPLVRFPLFWLAFKNAPMPLVRAASRWCLATDGHLNTYFHPWELCDLSGLGLPWYLRRVDGDALADRLGRYVDWLARRARLATYAELALVLLDGSGRPAPATAAPAARPETVP